MLTPDHKALLAKQGINEDIAKEWGITSAITEEDLPDDLLNHEQTITPGLVYPLRTVDGTIYHQIRRDNPPLDENGKPQGKYLQTKGVGSIINVPQMMAERVGKAANVVIVEGTKQTINACLYAPDDMLIIGVQGCQNWKTDSMPSADLTRILVAGDPDLAPEPDKTKRAAKKVTVIFDADVATNPNVYRAAKALRTAICTETGLSLNAVRFANLEFVGGTSGLDDYLGSQPEILRSGIFANLVNLAGKLGRAPAAKTKSTGARTTNTDGKKWCVDMEHGRIYSEQTVRGVDAGMDTTIRTVELAAAARIKRVESVIDERETGQASPKTLVLQITTPGDATFESEALPHPDVRVPDARLSYIGEWLGALPGTEGVTVKRDTRPNDDIAGAIREGSDDIESLAILPRTGWYLPTGEDPKWGWVAGNGAMTAEGIDESVVARPAATDFHRIKLADPDLDVPSERKKVSDAVNAFIAARDLFNQPFQWDVGVAAFGLSFLPVVPNVSLAFFGQRSSGKSTIAQAISTALNPAWGPNQTPMASFNASAAATDLLTTGMSDIFIHVDDFKPEASPKAAEKSRESLDGLLRRSYGSGGRRRGTVDPGVGGLAVRATDDAAPLTIITGEEVPVGSGFADSGLDRMVIIPMKPRSTFVPGYPDEEGKSNMGDSGEAALNTLYREMDLQRFPLVLAAYLRYIAHLVEQVEPLTTEKPGTHAYEDAKMAVFRRRITKQREDWADKIHTTDGQRLDDAHVSDRARRAVAGLLTGYDTFLGFAKDMKLTNARAARRCLDDLYSALINQIIMGTTTYMGGNRTPGQLTMDEIASLLSSGRAFLDGEEGEHTSAMRCIGARQTYKGQDAVFINPKAVEELTRTPARRVTTDLLAVSEGTDLGHGTINRRINGQPNVRCVGIPVPVWEGDEDDLKVQRSDDDRVVNAADLLSVGF